MLYILLLIFLASFFLAYRSTKKDYGSTDQLVEKTKKTLLKKQIRRTIYLNKR